MAGKILGKKAKRIVILNLSDIKPVPIGTAAVMSYLWDPTPYLDLGPAEAERRFLSAWLSTQYGKAAALELLPVVTGYFAMRYLSEPHNGKWLGEGDLSQTLRELADQLTCHLDPTAFPPGFPSPGAGSSSGCPLPSLASAAGAAELSAAGAGPTGLLLRAATALTSAVPADRRRFYASHTLTQLAIWHYTAAALGNVSAAVLSVGRSDHAMAAGQAAAAVDQVESLLAAERGGEGGVWAGWHLHDCNPPDPMADG